MSLLFQHLVDRNLDLTDSNYDIPLARLPIRLEGKCHQELLLQRFRLGVADDLLARLSFDHPPPEG